MLSFLISFIYQKSLKVNNPNECATSTPHIMISVRKIRNSTIRSQRTTSAVTNTCKVIYIWGRQRDAVNNSHSHDDWCGAYKKYLNGTTHIYAMMTINNPLSPSHQWVYKSVCLCQRENQPPTTCMCVYVCLLLEYFLQFQLVLFAFNSKPKPERKKKKPHLLFLAKQREVIRQRARAPSTCGIRWPHPTNIIHTVTTMRHAHTNQTVEACLAK